MSPRELIRELAEHHDEHLRWLRHRLGRRVEPDEVEDILQAAYARALAATSEQESARRRPTFADSDRAAAWLRTIALHLACDHERRSHGRPRRGNARRDEPLMLDERGWSRLADVRVDIEGDVAGAVDRDERRTAIANAMGALDSRHRQVIELRYRHDLGPEAIMAIEGLSRGQWEGRHTRAVNAVRRALARMHVSAECGPTRVLLRRGRAQFGRGPVAAIDHVSCCLPCRAFAVTAAAPDGAVPERPKRRNRRS